jgi:hypothetical protein
MYVLMTILMVFSKDGMVFDRTMLAGIISGSI